MRTLISVAVALCLSLPALAVEPKNPIEIKEWQVPDGGHPRDPDAVSAREVWFVGQAGDYLARLDPTTGAIVTRELNDDSGPHNLIVGDDGIVWYAGNRKGYIGRYDPTSNQIVRIEMPDERARDPHTLIFDRDQSHVWFTVQGGNFIGRLTVADRKVELIPVPTQRARPYGIVVAPDGIPWAVLVGTNKLASVDPGKMTLTEYELPDAGSRPRRLGATSDGMIYYVDYRKGRLGRLDPRTKKIRDWPMPSGDDARPYGMAVDGQDRVWFVETGVTPNLFVGFDPKSETFFSITEIPSGADAVRHMDYHAETRTVWFGTDAGTIGRADVGGE